jgi:flagellar biosynthesis protein FlhB
MTIFFIILKLLFFKLHVKTNTDSSYLMVSLKKKKKKLHNSRGKKKTYAQKQIVEVQRAIFKNFTASKLSPYKVSSKIGTLCDVATCHLPPATLQKGQNIYTSSFWA